MQTTIPFSGFYETDHDAELDSALEMMAGDNSGDMYPFAADLWQHIDYSKVHLAYAQEYAVQFAGLFTEETGISLALTAIKLVSPREYNFETDRIFAEVSEETVKAIFTYANKRDLRLLIIERFTSRSGFASFYPNSLEAWPEDVTEWDINQVGTLIESALRSALDIDEETESKWNEAISADLMERPRGNGFFDEILSEAMDADGIAILERCSAAREAEQDAEEFEETAE